MVEQQSGRSAIGNTDEQQGNITYGVMPEQVTRQLAQGSGSAFLVIQRVRQGEAPKVWSTGDPEETKSLFRLAYETSFDREPVTT